MQSSESSSPSQLPERRLRALAYANEVRLGRAELKRDIAARILVLDEVLVELAACVQTAEVRELLVEPPACVQTAEVGELLLAVPGIGPAKADRVFSRCRIAQARTVAGLSGRQRAKLIELLRR